MTASTSLIRCLGHAPDGRPNGCIKAAICLAHVIIRRTPYDGSCTIQGRRCQPGQFDAYVPVDRSQP